MALAVSDSFCY